MSDHTHSATGAAPQLASVTRLQSAQEASQPSPLPSSQPARKAANRTFDHAKVARLKAEIAGGTYEIDPFRVADKFIEHERNGA